MKLDIWKQNLPPKLSNDEILQLIAKYRQTHDKKVRDAVVYGNLRRVKALYDQYIWNKKDKGEDFLQQAALVIVNVVEKFDVENNKNFVGYLKRSVINEFINLDKKAKAEKRTAEIVSLSSPVYVSNSGDELSAAKVLSENRFDDEYVLSKVELKFVLEKFLPVFDAKKRRIFAKKFIKGQPVTKISQEENLTERAVYRILTAMQNMLKDIYSNGAENCENYQKLLKQYQLKRANSANIQALSSREKQVLKEYQKGLSQAEIGRNLNVSRQYINYVLQQSKKKLANTSNPVTDRNQKEKVK